MASFRQGDVIKVPFPYTDRATRQSRPALVVSAAGLPVPSLIRTAKIATIEASDATKLGRVPAELFRQVAKRLGQVLRFGSAAG